MAAVYRHRVETEARSLTGPSPRHVTYYDGEDAADAMAAWSKAIEQGVGYVTLESMRRAGT